MWVSTCVTCVVHTSSIFDSTILDLVWCSLVSIWDWVFFKKWEALIIWMIPYYTTKIGGVENFIRNSNIHWIINNSVSLALFCLGESDINRLKLLLLELWNYWHSQMLHKLKTSKKFVNLTIILWDSFIHIFWDTFTLCQEFLIPYSPCLLYVAGDINLHMNFRTGF